MDELTTNISEEYIQQHDAGLYVMSSFYIVICVLGLIGNTLAMAVVCNNPALKTASTIFIFNLALADFLFLLSVPFATANILMGRWVFGNAMCKIYFGCFGINIFASIYMLTVMSLDRYLAVCCSLKYNIFQKPPNCIICCLIIWFGATLLSLPLLIYARVEDNEMCQLYWPGKSAIAFTFYRMILGFFLPMVFITIFYMLIVVRICRQSPSLPQSRKRKRTRRVTMLVFCIILAFFFCWMPYWCYQIVFLIDLSLDTYVTRDEMMGYLVATALYKCNSALNPILYGFLSSSFRKAVLKLMKCEKYRFGEYNWYSTRISSFFVSIRTRKKSTSRNTRTSATELECNPPQCVSLKLLKEEKISDNGNLPDEG